MDLLAGADATLTTGRKAAGKSGKASHRGTAPAPAAENASALPPEREPAPIVHLPVERIHRRDLTKKERELVKRTVAKGLDDDQFDLFMHIVRRTGLDPIAKQIYAIVRDTKQKVTNERGFESWVKLPTMTIQTGIDGFRLVADRTGRYAPGRAPTFVNTNTGKLYSATAYVKKLTKDGTWHEVEATAFYDEFVQEFDGKPTKFWKDMPHNQLAKCAEALALRKSFPARLSGVYTDEEMGQADNFVQFPPSRAVASALDVHAAIEAERRAQDAAAEGAVISLNGEGSATGAPGKAGESPVRSTSKPAEPPAPRGSAPASPSTTRTDGKTAAGGMVTTIRQNAKRAGLFDEATQLITFPGDIAGQIGLDQLTYSPNSLASQINAGEIAKKLFDLGRERTASQAR